MGPQRAKVVLLGPPEPSGAQICTFGPPGGLRNDIWGLFFVLDLGQIRAKLTFSMESGPKPEFSTESGPKPEFSTESGLPGPPGGLRNDVWGLFFVLDLGQIRAKLTFSMESGPKPEFSTESGPKPEFSTESGLPGPPGGLRNGFRRIPSTQILPGL